MKFEYSQYWESDEFEDLVTRGIVGMHETRVKKEKKAPKPVRFNEDTFRRFKASGCYFTPNDREAYFPMNNDGKCLFVQQIDILNDGLPNRAVLTTKSLHDEMYLCSFYMEKLPFLPKQYNSEIKGTYFKLSQIMFNNTHVSGHGTFIVIDKNGNLQSCYWDQHGVDDVGRPIRQKTRPIIVEDSGNQEDYYSVWASATLQYYQDRRYLWNVQAHDGIAKATFGVYPEQIQSLFYARELPETSSGRKRPILHWVNAHQRRMKSGVDVDVEKYLRGTHEFVMNGTNFKIVNPLKNVV